jgi:nucleoside-diphosphate-sugar epimerase
VTGGTSLVGRLLIARLVEEGTHVVALARSAAAVEVVRRSGAEAVLGNLDHPEAWTREAQSVERVFHLARPRLRPPVRRRDIRGLERRARLGAAALRAAIGPGTPVTMESTGLAAAAHPAALSRPSLGAEAALADSELRVVRLGWVYGSEGVMYDLLCALRERRLRVMGPGENRWALISAADAVEALLAASAGDPGAYCAAEPDAPTQAEVIYGVCDATGLRRPDHLPPAMVRFSMGGAMADALMASMELRSDRLTERGWRPTSDWREGIPALLGAETKT